MAARRFDLGPFEFDTPATVLRLTVPITKLQWFVTRPDICFGQLNEDINNESKLVHVYLLKAAQPSKGVVILSLKLTLQRH